MATFIIGAIQQNMLVVSIEFELQGKKGNFSEKGTLANLSL